jgi:hypothetical protein
MQVIEWMTKERSSRPRLSEKNPSAWNPGRPATLQGAALAEAVVGAVSVADLGRDTQMQRPPAVRPLPRLRRRPSDLSDPACSEPPKQNSGETLGTVRPSERVWPEVLQQPSANTPKAPVHRDMHRLIRTEGGAQGGSMQLEPGGAERTNRGALPSGDSAAHPPEVELGSLRVRKEDDDDASGLTGTPVFGDAVKGQRDGKEVVDEQKLAQWETLKRAVGGRGTVDVEVETGDGLEVKPECSADTQVAASEDAMR